MHSAAAEMGSWVRAVGSISKEEDIKYQQSPFDNSVQKNQKKQEPSFIKTLHSAGLNFPFSEFPPKGCCCKCSPSSDAVWESKVFPSKCEILIFTFPKLV